MSFGIFLLALLNLQLIFLFIPKSRDTTELVKTHIFLFASSFLFNTENELKTIHEKFFEANNNSIIAGTINKSFSLLVKLAYDPWGWILIIWDHPANFECKRYPNHWPDAEQTKQIVTVYSAIYEQRRWPRQQIRHWMHLIGYGYEISNPFTHEINNGISFNDELS